MQKILTAKARNYYILGIIAQTLGMNGEAASNFFKSLFAIDDAAIYQKLGHTPKDHTERFDLLRANIPTLYTLTDKLFSTYRRTYTQELSVKEVSLVRNRITEGFKNVKIPIPTNKEISEKFAELLKKGRFFS